MIVKIVTLHDHRHSHRNKDPQSQITDTHTHTHWQTQLLSLRSTIQRRHTDLSDATPRHTEADTPGPGTHQPSQSHKYMLTGSHRLALETLRAHVPHRMKMGAQAHGALTWAVCVGGCVGMGRALRGNPTWDPAAPAAICPVACLSTHPLHPSPAGLSVRIGVQSLHAHMYVRCAVSPCTHMYVSCIVFVRAHTCM